MSNNEENFDWISRGSHNLHKVPVSTLLRWFLYDVNSDDAMENISIFNLTPISSEGDEKELSDSNNRLDAISEILPLLNFYANATAEYAYAMNKQHMSAIADLPKEVMDAAEEALKDFYVNVTFSALVSAFASAAELRIINLNGTHTEIKRGD